MFLISWKGYSQSDLDLKYECYAENYLGTEIIDVDICSKNTFDTKEYYYWRNSKKDIYISPQIVLKINPNDTAYYSQYVNLTEKAKVEALEEERWRALKAGTSNVVTSSIAIIITCCAAALFSVDQFILSAWIFCMKLIRCECLCK